MGEGNQHCLKNTARRNSPENIAGGVAAATIALACAWIAFTNIPGAETDIAASLPPTSQSDVAQIQAPTQASPVQVPTPDTSSEIQKIAKSSVSFAERFGPVAKAPVVAVATPKDAAESDEARAIRSVAMALMDPKYKLGAAPASFMVKEQPLSIAAVPQPDPDPEPAPFARPLPPVRMASLGPTPLPQMRPTFRTDLNKPDLSGKPDLMGKPDLTSKSVLAVIPDNADKPEVIPREMRIRATSHEVMVQRARATVLAAASGPGASVSGGIKSALFEKLFGGSPAPTAIAYAAPDGGVRSDGSDAVAMNQSSAYDRYTAIYDISARTVYMPDGSKLEAHSGLGSKMDEPKYAHVKMNGPTPPHIYDLKPRETLFHGVAALRMTPVGGEAAIYGRTGLLTHSYLLGPRGDSNGCVSFRDYAAFIKAYRNNEVKRLVVVASLH